MHLLRLAGRVRPIHPHVVVLHARMQLHSLSQATRKPNADLLENIRLDYCVHAGVGLSVSKHENLNGTNIPLQICQ
jgi:hypothetical protein